MKRFSLLASLLILSSNSIAGPRESPGMLLAQANSAYQKGDYVGAEEAYRKLLGTGIESAPLFYNLANACFKQKRLGEAIYYWETARRLDPHDPDILNNLSFASLLVVDRIELPPDPWPVAFVRTAVRLLSPRQEAWLLLASFFLANCLVAAYFFSRTPRAALVSLAGAGTLLLVAVLCAGSLGWKSWERARDREAVILEQKIDARSGPALENVTVFSIHEGTIVRIRSENSGWHQVSLPNGWNGWVPSSALREIRR